MNPITQQPHAARIDQLLRREPVVWLSTVRPDGGPHLVPIWFSWDGREILIASKPGAQKVRNLRANPTAMLALGEAEDDFDVGLLEGLAELADEPASVLLPATHLEKYREQMARIGLDRDEFLSTYSQVIRIRPTRYLPWHGRSPRVVVPETARETGPLRRLTDRLFDRLVAAFRPGRGDPARLGAAAG